MNTHGDRDPVPEPSLREYCERCKAEARSVELYPDKILGLLDSEAEAERLRAALERLERQSVHTLADVRAKLFQLCDATERDYNPCSPRIVPNGAYRSGLMKDYGGKYNPDHKGGEFLRGRAFEAKCIRIAMRDVFHAALSNEPDPLQEARQAVVEAAMKCKDEFHSSGLPYVLEIELRAACDNLAKLEKGE